jgi:hypothetical protein
MIEMSVTKLALDQLRQVSSGLLFGRGIARFSAANSVRDQSRGQASPENALYCVDAFSAANRKATSPENATVHAASAAIRSIRAMRFRSMA